MKKRKTSILVALLIAVLVGWLIWGNLSVEISRFTVMAKDLPKEFDHFSIAHISDLHHAEYGKENERLLNLLKNENPDIIAITGDLIDASHTDLDAATSFVRQAVEIAPCYYVTGNHEAWIGLQYEELKTALENVGVTVLQDEAVEWKRGDACIQLIGLNDPEFSEGDNLLSDDILETKLSQMNRGDGFSILLSHRPECFNVYQNENVDLVLSGHAHGGQFRLPFLGGVIAPGQGLFPKYDAGIYTEKGTTMVVSRGLGNSVIPVRINNRPEIVIVELRCSGGGDISCNGG